MMTNRRDFMGMTAAPLLGAPAIRHLEESRTQVKKRS